MFVPAIPATVLQKMRRHAQSSLDAEICGVLIGDAAPPGAARVTACIAGEEARQGGAHVTFTQETWEHIYKIKDAQYPEQAIVGWYHSHPGFGIFLSEYDLFIHQNFFNAPHQIAWVIDPHSGEEGCFGWQAEAIVPLPEIRVLLDTEGPLAKQGRGEETPAPAFAEPVAAALPIEPPAPAASDRELWHALLWLIIFAAGVVIGIFSK